MPSLPVWQSRCTQHQVWPVSRVTLTRESQLQRHVRWLHDPQAKGCTDKLRLQLMRSSNSQASPTIELRTCGRGLHRGPSVEVQGAEVPVHQVQQHGGHVLLASLPAHTIIWKSLQSCPGACSTMSWLGPAHGAGGAVDAAMLWRDAQMLPECAPSRRRHACAHAGPSGGQRMQYSRETEDSSSVLCRLLQDDRAAQLTWFQ